MLIDADFFLPSSDSRIEASSLLRLPDAIEFDFFQIDLRQDQTPLPDNFLVPEDEGEEVFIFRDIHFR